MQGYCVKCGAKREMKFSPPTKIFLRLLNPLHKAI